MIKKVKIDEETAWKNRRMIMISTASINQINCMKYRNKINNIFKKINIHDILIIGAEMFKTKHFIIFTMIEKNTANQLVENRIIWEKNFQFSIIYIDETTTESETSPRCSLGNGPLGLANIWSRLLKHNWWDPLYGRIRIHSDVFFDFTFNENSLLYGYINRASPEFQPMHVYDQQLWSLFHCCGPFSLFLNS